jgi:hypothetical protein
VHDEFEALLQVSCVAQWVTSAHSAQVSCVPSWRYRPVAQAVHCEFPALVQVSCVAQPAMSLQATHWLPSRYVPDAQTIATQLLWSAVSA